MAARDTMDGEVAAHARAEWRSRLCRRLAADPVAAAELRVLLAELAPDADAYALHRGGTNSSVGGGVFHGTVIQARNIGRLHHRQGPGER
ncbi:hypothetical protein ABZ791_09405 [Streptomyces huasconensis]|uniref:Uncharacterized protein n=1 Tax=Streptomyces huasconensis TaxID=1854574 RepID=A0ABV3M221_9ACTN